MNAEAFLQDHPRPQPWKDKAAKGLSPHSVFLGQGANALEVAVASAAARPLVTEVRALWKQRHGRRPSPLLLVVLYDGKATLCGPVGEEPPVYDNVDAGQAERLARQAIAELDRHAATRLLTSMLPETEQELPGLRNAGMFSAHALRTDVPTLPEWVDACRAATKTLDKRGKELIEALGFTIERHDQSVSFLRSGTVKRAVAMFLDENETPEADSARFSGMSPVSYALAVADRENVPYVLLTRGPQIRLYASATDVGVGRKGRSETFVEANLALLPDDRAGYLPIVFGAKALIDGGTFQAILDRSRDFAGALGTRLRERVYNEVVPHLAGALGRRALKGKRAQADLDFLYQQTLVILFRLLFVAYAEDKDLLPYHRNENYRRQALKTLARELAERDPEAAYDERAKSYWARVRQLWRAVDEGDADLGVPPYNGGLFSEDPAVSDVGAALAKFELTNAEIGPALHGMLIDVEQRGPVDFRSLSVREFGTIYEGLLESNLSVAPADLTLDKDGTYLPAVSKGQQVVVVKGDVYLHNRSGARKATGSYFTKPFAVEHLLHYALESALDEHLARLRVHIDAGNDHKAANDFFDFRCADIAMGSGHFLVAAVDHIEARLSSFLAENPLPGVRGELERLRSAARDALKKVGREIEADDLEDSQLLRRQVARRCIYGVDKNRIAVELARLALWIHTFVPGLPLSFLDHSLVHGDSLTGIATLDEAIAVLDPETQHGTISVFRPQIEALLERAQTALGRLAKTIDATAKEIVEARRAHAEVVSSVAPARDLFDLLVGVRLGSIPAFDEIDETKVTAHPMLQAARDVTARMGSLHFPLTFPEVFLRERAGFDCLLGNPPWDKVRFESQQFWVARSPGLNALPANEREGAIAELRRRNPTDAELEDSERAERERLQTFADRGFRYQGRGRHGHHDFAKMFVERATSLLSTQGQLGYVLPRVCLVLGGWTDLRELLLHDSTVTTLQARNRAGWLFDDIDARLMIVLATRGPVREASGPHIWPAVTRVEQLQGATIDNAIFIGETELRTLSDTLVVPWFNGPGDRPTFDQMRSRARLGGGQSWIKGKADSARWDFSGSGRHKDHASTTQLRGAWRVLMTRHVDAFRIDTETAFQRFINEPKDLASLKLGVDLESGHPMVADGHPLIVYRYPTMNDNTRTLIATVLPEAGYLPSKGYVHGILHPSGTSTTKTLALLAYLNSFTCDWWVRRFVDRHVTAPVLENLPLPEWTEDDVALASRFSAELLVRKGTHRMVGGEELQSDSAFAKMDDSEIVAKIERVVLQGFSLSSTHLRAILDDFTQDACPDSLRELLKGIGD